MPEQVLITAWGSYFLKGLFRLVRNTFRLAGQDSFTDPPMQNPDLFESLLNVVPPVQGDIDRRWGYRFQNANLIFPAPTDLGVPSTQSLYQNSLTNARQLVYAAGLRPVKATSEEGQITNSNIFTPTSPLALRMLNSRSYGYFSNGTSPDYKKWDGATGVSKWGIDINNIVGAGLIVGPNTPTVVTDLGTSGGAASQIQPTGTGTDVPVAGGWAWNNPGNIVLADGTTSDSTIAAAAGFPSFARQHSDWIQATNFGFSVPGTATITGIQVDITKSSTSNGGTVLDKFVQLVVAGVIGSSDRALAGGWPSSLTDVTYGGATDMWGLSLTPTDVNAVGFGVALQAENPTFQDNTASVDFVQITVYYTVPPSGTMWANPNNIKTEDGLVASVVASIANTSELRSTNYGLAVPGSNIIQGIQVDIKASFSDTTPNLQPILVKASTAYGNRKTAPVLTPALGFVTYGGPNDLWGGVWTPADVNATGFGTQFLANTPAGTSTLNVDVVRITIYSAIGPFTLGAPTGGGAITLSVGRVYTLAFKNSVTGHLSEIVPFTVSTGPLTSQNQPLTGIPVSADPQVDTKVLLATADGGDETTLFLLAEIPNANTTYTDSTPETVLLLNNIYLNQDSTGAVLGVADNSPPPVGTVNPVYHRGRVYMHTPSNLYYSKSEGDLLTSSATLTGKYEEAWPALNYFDIAEGAEVNRGLLSDGQVLYIGTDKRIVRLFGDGPATFSEPESLFLHTGIANQDVWKIIFMEGNPLGAMWLTPDRRVLGSDFNTYQDIGLPIQDILDSVNRTTYQHTSWASYVGISNWNLYILAIPTGTSVQPNTFLVFDLKGKMWYQWTPTDQMLSGLYNITIGGQPQFVTVSALGSVYAWDPTLTQDRVGGGAFGGTPPVNFVLTARTSWQDFTDAAARKFLNEIEVITGDPNMTVTIEGASTKIDFDSPHIVVLNAPLVKKPRGEYFVPLAAFQTKDRFYRFTFTSSDSGTDVIRGWNIQGGVVHRL